MRLRILTALFFILLIVAGCRNATKATEEADSAAELGGDGKCWHLIRLESSNRALEWLNEEDVNGYELVSVAPNGPVPTVNYLTRSTHPGDCRTPDATQRRAEEEQAREVETRLAQEAAARRAAETRVAELEALLRQACGDSAK